MGIEKGPTVGSSGEYWSMVIIEPALCGNDKFLKIMKTRAVVKFDRKLKN